MNCSKITHKFNGNLCELKIPVSKSVQIIENCDVFVDDYNFILIADMDSKRFKCPERFDIKDMKNIPVAFNSESWEYTCQLPCHPGEAKAEDIEKGELDKVGSKIPESISPDLRTMSRITDSCILTVDGKVSVMKSNFCYGFAGRFRGIPKYGEDYLSRICRITNPSLFSMIRRTIKREIDELNDFCPDQYKLNFVELQIPEGHDNPLKYTIPYEDSKLTIDEECVLHNITRKDFTINMETVQTNVDCCLISILLAICYDIRTTSNELTCESAWTRTILSTALSYFEHFENLNTVVESFLRRCLIYPLYRNYDLGRLCVEDAIEALQKSTPWILKQLLATANCFCCSENDRKALNRYFLKDCIRYVAKCLTDDHRHLLSRNLKNVLLNTNKKKLRLGLQEIETELLKELIEDLRLISITEESEAPVTSDSESSSAEDDKDNESETDDSDNSGTVIEQNI